MQGLRTYEVPNEWVELDEAETSDSSQELMSVYGPFSVILYVRIKKLKLFSLPTNPLAFLENLITFYIRNAEGMIKDQNCLKNIKLLVSLFPSPRKFIELTDFHRLRGKERVFLKVALDITIFYYKTTEIPLFQKLQTEILPLALCFYNSLTSQILAEINTELTSITSLSSITL